MASYPDMRELAKFATEDYSRIDSMQSIRPPFPAQGTPNWWALRLRYEELLFAEIRRNRAGSGVRAGAVNNVEAEAAKWAALGNEQADADYKGFVPSATDVAARQRSQRERLDWLDGQLKSAVRKVG